jgi:predicted acyltransferase
MTSPGTSVRLVSLDQFRGYTVLGMLFVNFVGPFIVTPAVFKHHHTYCSYADTIMPQFFFAVGFAFRLTFGRRVHSAGWAAAYRRVARRLLGLGLVAILFYTYHDAWDSWTRLGGGQAWATLEEWAKRIWFQTLMHIAVTSLWILPVIRSGAAVRSAYLLFSAGAHVLLSHWFNFAWVNSGPQAIDGGPLGFLTWSIPMLVGSLACDAVVDTSRPRAPAKLIAWALALMMLGYGLSCATRFYDVPGDFRPGSPERAQSPVVPSGSIIDGRFWTDYLAEPPFVAPPPATMRQGNYWMMSQRSGSLSYQTFAAGFSLLVFLFFQLGCDHWGWQIGIFRTLGTNALVAYLLAGTLERPLRRLLEHNASVWAVAADFLLFLACVCVPLRIMEWRRVFVRL